MATSTTVVVDTESWGEYVTAAHQISTLSKRHPNSDKGVSGHKTGLRLVGFCAIAKGYFQACALRYFWAFLLPAAAVEGRRSYLLKVPFFFTKEEYTKFDKAKRKARLAGCKNNVFSSW